MPDHKVLASMGYVSGISNIDSPASLFPEVGRVPAGIKALYPLQIAENVFIDNSSHLQSRTAGQTLRVSGATHSAWAKGSVFLYVLLDTLYSMDIFFNSTALLSGLTPGLPMSYAQINDRVYFSNGVNIGYVKNGTAYAISMPSIAFKQPLPAGKFIAHYRSRLYSGTKTGLYISDALADCYDVRRGFKQFTGSFTMIRPVENGIYIADEAKTYFMSGLAPEEFQLNLIEENPVISYTDANVSGKDISDGAGEELWAVWTSVKGICIGNGDGQVTNVTRKRFSMTNHVQGAAMVYNNGEIMQYINSMRQ